MRSISSLFLMKKLIRTFSALVLVFVLCLCIQADAKTNNNIHQGKNPCNYYRTEQLGYTKNIGQWKSTAQYLFHVNGFDMWITNKGFVIDKYVVIKKSETLTRRKSGDDGHLYRKGHTVNTEFVGKGVNQKTTFVSTDQLRQYKNYFIGSTSDNWKQNVPIFGSVLSQSIYKEIDVRYYVQNERPRYDIIVHPHGNPNEIAMKITGANTISITKNGFLEIVTSLGTVEQRHLFAYQNCSDAKKQINCSFKMLSNNTIAFEVGAYDKSKPLIIDPLVFSTYLGGSGDEAGNGVAVDAGGNIYVTGRTSSTNYPTTSGAYQTSYGTNTDVFITKINPTGTSVLYSTYLGGSNNDQGNDIDVDASGNVFVTGFTKSTDFDITSGVFQTTNGGGTDDVFVTKLNSAGNSLIYSTYIGGSGADIGLGIKIDATGNAYVTGRTSSSNYDIIGGSFQTTIGGGDDVFVTKINSTGTSLIYSTFIGGTSNEEGSDIAVDASGNAYITGYTASTNFDITSGVFQTTFGGAFFFGDIFVTKLNSNGTTLLFSTFLGGSDDDFANDIAIDGSNNVYVAGYTYSSNFDLQSPIQNSLTGQTDITITKLNSTGTALVFSTYLGGSDDDAATGIVVNSSNEVIITGASYSNNYDITSGSYQTTSAGDYDVICTRLNASGSSLSYSSYLGGSGYDYGNALALDLGGNPIITGITSSSNFDVTGGVIQGALSGTSDAFVTKFGIGSSLSLTSPNTSLNFCKGNSYNITWSSQGVTNVKIDLSTDGGSTFPTTITSSTSAATSQYSWTVPTSTPTGSLNKIRVSDAANASLFDVSDVNFSILGKAVFSISHDAGILYPPNQSLRAITSTINISGGCSPSWVLKQITSSEADAGVLPNDQSNDIQNASLNTSDNTFSLRCERIPSGGKGRTYTVTYSLTDGGSTRDTNFFFLVPINLGFSKDIGQGVCITSTNLNVDTYVSGTVSYSVTLGSSTNLKVRIYNSLGKDIVWLAQGFFSTGTHLFSWNGKDRNNRDVPNGTYYIQVTADCGTSAPLLFKVVRP